MIDLDALTDPAKAPDWARCPDCRGYPVPGRIIEDQVCPDCGGTGLDPNVAALVQLARDQAVELHDIRAHVRDAEMDARLVREDRAAMRSALEAVRSEWMTQDHAAAESRGQLSLPDAVRHVVEAWRLHVTSVLRQNSEYEAETDAWRLLFDGRAPTDLVDGEPQHTPETCGRWLTETLDELDRLRRKA